MAIQQTLEQERHGDTPISQRGGRALGQPRQDRYQQNGFNDIDIGRLSRGLGWFSIGLGLAEILTSRQLAKLIGVRHRPVLMRLMGIREITSGVGILAQPRSAGWLWSRVGGDMIDISLLASALASERNERDRVAAATAAVLGVTALDVYCSEQLSRGSILTQEGKIRVAKSQVVNRSPEDCYRFWHDFENFPRFMSHLESVRVTGERKTHWIAKAPAGTNVEWDAEIVSDQPEQSISWRSLPGADVENSGTVRFERAPGNRGTIVRVELEYDPPGGVLGKAVAKLFGEEPQQQVDDDVRKFKQIIETGDVAKSEASIHTGMHPAQPDAGA